MFFCASLHAFSFFIIRGFVALLICGGHADEKPCYYALTSDRLVAETSNIARIDSLCPFNQCVVLCHTARFCLFAIRGFVVFIAVLICGDKFDEKPCHYELTSDLYSHRVNY